MHINLESDYAVRIVQYLAQSNERRDAQSIADSTCVSLRFTLKIMRKLVAADIVQSFKGAHGGYTLSRPASSITLRRWKAPIGSAGVWTMAMPVIALR